VPYRCTSTVATLVALRCALISKVVQGLFRFDHAILPSLVRFVHRFRGGFRTRQSVAYPFVSSDHRHDAHCRLVATSCGRASGRSTNWKGSAVNGTGPPRAR
jgi:hypothetical protein